MTDATKRPAPMPYVIGQWVVGTRFYGRQDLVATLLDSRRRWSWVAGLRRIGKTSLLRQLEHRLQHSPDRVPLVWDLQGADCAEELAATLSEGLLDAEAPFADRGIDVETVVDDDPFAVLSKLTTALVRSGPALLLLLDEADELRTLHDTEPQLMPRLWTALEDLLACHTNGCATLASSVRLCGAAADDNTLGERLRQLPAPHWLGPLTHEAAHALAHQSQLPADARPTLEASTAAKLVHACGAHPMLLQVATKRYLEARGQGTTLDATLAGLATDPSVHHMLAVDFALLEAAEQDALHALATGVQGSGVEVPTSSRLTSLGVVTRDKAGRTIFGNAFWHAFLTRSSEASETDSIAPR